MVYIHENRGARPIIRSLNVRLCVEDLLCWQATIRYHVGTRTVSVLRLAGQAACDHATRQPTRLTGVSSRFLRYSEHCLLTERCLAD